MCLRRKLILKNKKNFTAISLFLLSACTTPKVIKSYDEFTGKHTCVSNQFRIFDEGVLCPRHALLKLQSKGKDGVTVILTDMSVSSLFCNKKPSVIEGPTLGFTITTSNNQVEDYIFNAHTKKTTVSRIEHASLYTSIVLFDLSREKLRNLAESEKTLFSFKTSKDFIKGELSAYNKKNIHYFLNNCPDEYKNIRGS